MLTTITDGVGKFDWNWRAQGWLKTKKADLGRDARDGLFTFWSEIRSTLR